MPVLSAQDKKQNKQLVALYHDQMGFRLHHHPEQDGTGRALCC